MLLTREAIMAKLPSSRVVLDEVDFLGGTVQICRMTPDDINCALEWPVRAWRSWYILSASVQPALAPAEWEQLYSIEGDAVRQLAAVSAAANNIEI